VRLDPIDSYEETSVATPQLDASELDATQRKTSQVDMCIDAEPITHQNGRARCGAGRTPHPKAHHEHERDEDRDHPSAPLAEEPKHRGGSMPRLKREL
jgi:hypothetical protein